MIQSQSEEGIGRLIIDSIDGGEIRYKINIYKEGNPKKIDGELTANVNILYKLSENPNCLLKLDTGKEVPFIFKKIINTTAMISINGPI